MHGLCGLVSSDWKNGYHSKLMSDYDADRPRPWLLRRLLVLAAAVGFLVICYGWIRRPALPFVGDSLSTNTGQFESRVRSSLRVASFNIRAGRGIDGDTDLIRTANLLGSFDVIGLNEVRGKLYGSPGNQAEELARILQLPWAFAPGERRFWHDSFGNALFSRVPISHYSMSPLPHRQWDGYRSVLHAKVRLDGAVVNLLITHIDRRDQDRATQFRAAAELFLSLAEPAILMGDLNTAGDDLLMQNLLQTSGVQDPIGDTATLPAKERIDWILTRGLQTLEAGAVSSAVSDHPLVWAHLVLPPTGIERPTTQSTTRPTSPGD